MSTACHDFSQQRSEKLSCFLGNLLKFVKLCSFAFQIFVIRVFCLFARESLYDCHVEFFLCKSAPGAVSVFVLAISASKVCICVNFSHVYASMLRLTAFMARTANDQEAVVFIDFAKGSVASYSFSRRLCARSARGRSVSCVFFSTCDIIYSKCMLIEGEKYAGNRYS